MLEISILKTLVVVVVFFLYFLFYFNLGFSRFAINTTVFKLKFSFISQKVAYLRIFNQTYEVLSKTNLRSLFLVVVDYDKISALILTHTHIHTNIVRSVNITLAKFQKRCMEVNFQSPLQLPPFTSKLINISNNYSLSKKSTENKMWIKEEKLIYVYLYYFIFL